MGITKTVLFTDAQNELAVIAKALGHPARVCILQHLIAAKACINSDLVNETGLAQATVSQHLRALKEVGIIQGTIDGVSMNYCINPVRWQEVRHLINGLFDQIDSDKSDCC